MSQRGQYLHLRARPSTAAWSRSSTMKTGSVEYGFWPTERAESKPVFHEGSAWFVLILLVWYMGKAVSSQGLRQPVHLLPQRLSKSTSIAKQNKLIKVQADTMKFRFLSSSSKWAYVSTFKCGSVLFGSGLDLTLQLRATYWRGGVILGAFSPSSGEIYKNLEACRVEALTGFQQLFIHAHWLIFGNQQ